jgi:ribosomal protein S18 acetylase RimI-like enzyme
MPIAMPLTRTVGRIWVNQETSSDVRATVHSFLAQAEYAGEIVCGIAIATVAQVAGLSVALLTGGVLFALAALLVQLLMSHRSPQASPMQMPRPEAASGEWDTEAAMKDISLAMFRPNLLDLPEFAAPEHYVIRRVRPGDEDAWMQIEVAAGEFPDVHAAQTRMLENFDGPFNDATRDWCYLMEDPDGCPIATATASSDSFDGDHIGRVGWVGMIPEYQRRGLSKPLLATVMRRLALDHSAAFLTTQTTSYRAIHLYLQFGFTPILQSPECAEGWRIVEKALGKRVLPTSAREIPG